MLRMGLICGLTVNKPHISGTVLVVAFDMDKGSGKVEDDTHAATSNTTICTMVSNVGVIGLKVEAIIVKDKGANYMSIDGDLGSGGCLIKASREHLARITSVEVGAVHSKTPQNQQKQKGETKKEKGEENQQ
jgi:hypothetical protein